MLLSSSSVFGSIPISSMNSTSSISGAGSPYEYTSGFNTSSHKSLNAPIWNSLEFTSINSYTGTFSCCFSSHVKVLDSAMTSCETTLAQTKRCSSSSSMVTNFIGALSPPTVLSCTVHLPLLCARVCGKCSFNSHFGLQRDDDSSIHQANEMEMLTYEKRMLIIFTLYVLS